MPRYVDVRELTDPFSVCIAREISFITHIWTYIHKASRIITTLGTIQIGFYPGIISTLASFPYKPNH